MYVADDGNNRIRKITSGGVVTTLAGNATAASVDGVLNTDAVAQTVIEVMDAETFLILPHPEVKEYLTRKTGDYDRWLRGMRRLRDKSGEGQRRQQ